MREGRIGKRTYAFELEWLDLGGRPASEVIREHLDGGQQAQYVVLTRPVAGAKKKKQVPGVAGYFEGERKGKIFSYAAALAATFKDGIFVAPTEAGRLWYLVVNDGQVVPETDRSLERDDALRMIDVLRVTYDQLTVYAVDGTGVPDAREFDPERAISKAKVEALRPVVASQAKGIFAIIAVLGITGALYWATSKPAAPDAAAQFESQRVAFVQSAKEAMAALPDDPNWVVFAVARAKTAFPDEVAGWRSEGVKCTPTNCTGTYVLPQSGSGFGYTPLEERFGVGMVKLLPDGRSLEAMIPLQLPVRDVPEEAIMAPASNVVPMLDLMGAVPLRFYGVGVDSKTDVAALNEQLGAPAGLPVLTRETFATLKTSDETGGGRLDLLSLKGQAQLMASGGFVAATVAYSDGAGTIPVLWKVEWTRIRGGAL